MWAWMPSAVTLAPALGITTAVTASIQRGWPSEDGDLGDAVAAR